MNTKAITEEQYHLALGRAVSMFGIVEVSLGTVLVATVRPAGETILLRAFFAIQNFRDRLNFVDQAVKAALEGKAEELLPKWTILVTRANKVAQRRNKLVHAQTWIEEEIGYHGRRHPIYDNNRRMRPAEVREASLTPKKLNEAGRTFHDIAADFRDFAKEMNARPA